MTTPLKKGAENVSEIFLAIGRAMNNWNAAQSALDAMFVILCGSDQKIAKLTYQIADQALRKEMLLLALSERSRLVGPEMKGELMSILDRLSELAPKASEIASGSISDESSTRDAVLVRKGLFLKSGIRVSHSLAQQNTEFAYNAIDINEWATAVHGEYSLLQDLHRSIGQLIKSE